IFSDNIIWLLKDLMQWDARKMALVKAPFNKNKRNVLKPEILSPWKIEHFPLEWESSVCNTFTPVGYLTEHVISEHVLAEDILRATGSVNIEETIVIIDNTIEETQENTGKAEHETDIVESAFFRSLEADIVKIGYVLLKPEAIMGKEEEAYIDDYLQEWQADEDDG
ncbi:MAG: hypothetical protein HQK62_15480, partial [Desulfamplus sp.]|nr:hypothetical protein [Desulfamplus sp.]